MISTEIDFKETEIKNSGNIEKLYHLLIISYKDFTIVIEHWVVLLNFCDNFFLSVCLIL